MDRQKYCKPAQGCILISEPFMRDTYFQRAVVLLAEHNEDGTFGIILNKPLNLKLNDVVSGFPDFQAPVYFGGPVKTDSLFYIHTRGKDIEGSVKILDSIYWGGQLEVVVDMMQNKLISPDEIRFYLGYSGWDPKQLDNELNESSWVVTQVRASQLLKNPPETMWSRIVKILGREFSGWVNYPTDPSLN